MSPATRPVVVVIVLGTALVAILAPFSMPATYSWTEHGVSESAAQGIDGAWVTRLGFLLYGLAVLALTQLRHRAWRPLGTSLHGVFAVSMFAVASFSTRPWQDDAVYVKSEDLLHSVFATTMGFGFILGVAAVMVARRPPSLRAALPDIVAMIGPTIISLSMSAGAWGLLQRMMFLIAAAWYSREAFLSRHAASYRPRGQRTGAPLRR